jgi:hypothetical protein
MSLQRALALRLRRHGMLQCCCSALPGPATQMLPSIPKTAILRTHHDGRPAVLVGESWGVPFG